MDEARCLHRQEVHDGKVVRLSIDTVLLPNGCETQLEFVRHPGAAAVVPVDDAGHVLLVRQYRYAAGGWLLEIPAGKLDPGESPEECARREVEEEIGFRPRLFRPLGAILTTPGFTDEQIWLYLATDLVRTRQTLQPDELLRIERVPLAAAVRMAEDGEIRDAKSICGLLRVRRQLGSDGLHEK